MLNYAHKCGIVRKKSHASSLRASEKRYIQNGFVSKFRASFIHVADFKRPIRGGRDRYKRGRSTHTRASA